MLKGVRVVVDVLRDGPDEAEAVEEGLHSVRDRLQLALRDDFELALERLQELYEVLRLRLLLEEGLVRVVELRQRVAELVVLVAEELEDLLGLGGKLTDTI